MIRRITALALLLSTVLPISAAELEAADKKELVTRATTMVEGFKKGEVETIIGMTHPSIHVLAGDKAAFEKMARDAMKSIADTGLKVEEVKLGEPTRTWQAGKETVCFVPVTLVFSMQERKIRSTTYYVAIKGESTPQWLFLDGSGIGKNPDLLKQLLPGLPDDVVLPEIRQEALEAN